MGTAPLQAGHRRPRRCRLLHGCPPTCLHLPLPNRNRRRREWAEQHGLPQFASQEYDAALEAVCSRSGVRLGFKHRWRGGQGLLLAWAGSAGRRLRGLVCRRSPSHACALASWRRRRELPAPAA